MEIVEIAALGVAGGVIAGLFGVGGGTIFVPTLVLLVGLAEVHAVGTSLAAMVPLALWGTWRQRRGGTVSLRAAAIIGAAAAATAGAGAFVAEQLPGATLRWGLAAVIVVIAIRLVSTTRRAAPTAGTERGPETSP